MQSKVASDSKSDSQEFNFKPHQTLPLYLEQEILSLLLRTG